MKILFRMFLILLSVIISAILVLVIVLLIYSPGKPDPFLDDEGKVIAGSISEKTFVKIGGIRQGMFIRGRNTGNPVLLYVHGGPAFPNYFLFEKYKPGLDEYFTVCYWEQRGGGLSYDPGIPIQTMTFGQLTSDAIDVATYLSKRFNKDKIYLMAHSGGTPIAIKAAEKAPQLFNAYIGMAQITDQASSERIAYRYMLDKFTDLNDDKTLAELKKYPLLETGTGFAQFYRSPVRDKAMHELGIGTMHNMRSVFTGVFVPVWLCKAYTLKEKVNIWVSKFRYIKKAKFIDELFSLDISETVPKLEVPVYFFSGKYDLTVNIDLSRYYLEKLQAPVKGFYTFTNSAHSPLFEEPERTIEVMLKDVLNGTSKMSDK